MSSLDAFMPATGPMTEGLSFIIAALLPIVLLSVSTCPAQTDAPDRRQASIFDVCGKRICACDGDEKQTSTKVLYLPSLSQRRLTDRHGLPAGYYVLMQEERSSFQQSGLSSPAKIAHAQRLHEKDSSAQLRDPAHVRSMMCGTSPKEEFWFEDITDSFLPSDEWPAEDIAAGDLDGDGMIDVVFTLSVLGCPGPQEPYMTRVWIQNADGTFSDETVGRFPPISMPSREAELFDVDGDGDVDVFLAGSGAEGYPPAALLINDGGGYFSNQSAERLPDLGEACFVWVAEPGYFDDNEAIDLVLLVASVIASDVEPVMLLNDGDGSYSVDTEGRIPVSDYGYFDIVVLDIDDDGRDDIGFANIENGDVAQGRTACFHNMGDGYFSDETEDRLPEGATATRCIEIVDAEGDGDQDFLEVGFTILGEPVTLFLNDGSGYFTSLVVPCPENCRWVNDAILWPFNRDPYADIFLANVDLGESASDILLKNNDDYSFVDASLVLPDRVDFTTSCALFDHNNDLTMDVFMANAGPSPETGDLLGQNALYRNHPGDSVLARSPGTTPHKDLLRLEPPIPNPFRTQTSIRYFLPHTAMVRLSIHDCTGRLHEMLPCELMCGGWHAVTWMTEESPTGVYICRLSIGPSRECSKKLLCIH